MNIFICESYIKDEKDFLKEVAKWSLGELEEAYTKVIKENKKEKKEYVYHTIFSFNFSPHLITYIGVPEMMKDTFFPQNSG